MANGRIRTYITISARQPDLRQHAIALVAGKCQMWIGVPRSFHFGGHRDKDGVSVAAHQLEGTAVVELLYFVIAGLERGVVRLKREWNLRGFNLVLSAESEAPERHEPCGQN